MNCQDRACFLTDLVLGEIDPREGAQLRAHVRECASCAAALAEIQQVAGQLSSELQEEPQSQLTQRQWSELRRKAHWRPATKIGIGLGIAASGLFALGMYWYASHFCPAPSLHDQSADSSPLTVEMGEVQLAKTSASPNVATKSEEIKAAPIPMDTRLYDSEEEEYFAPADSVIGMGAGSGAASGEPSQSTQSAVPPQGAEAKAEAESRVAYQRSSGGAFGGRRNLVANKSRSKDSPERDSRPGWSAEVEQEDYRGVPENPFVTVRDYPLSTFSVDVDTASYANARRFLNEGKLPPREAVRVEEFLNYFSYDYPSPTADQPVGMQAELARCPWSAKHLLLRVALQARKVAAEKRPPCNLVFLIDVSGSMEPANKLPLLKSGLRALVSTLAARDRVAIVTYAGEASTALASTSCEDKKKILDTIEGLKAEGSTNGGAGIRMAYEMARANFAQEGVNRVLIGTDGDFNVGVTDQGELVDLIQEEAKSGVFLSVLGFGMGNLKDATLESLADKGNGQYAYIDTFQEARKTLLDQASANLVTVAKDVKLQIEFNPARVASYRLIGYENRALAAKDFNNDRKDAGEMGSGHAVTALYEIVPVGAKDELAEVDPLRYQPPKETVFEMNQSPVGREFANLKLRYKLPEGNASRLVEKPVEIEPVAFAKASPDFRFAASVAAFAMVLRDSSKRGGSTIADVIAWAEGTQGKDADGYRGEFLHLLRVAQRIQEKR